MNWKMSVHFCAWYQNHRYSTNKPVCLGGIGQFSTPWALMVCHDFTIRLLNYRVSVQFCRCHVNRTAYYYSITNSPFSITKVYKFILWWLLIIIEERTKPENGTNIFLQKLIVFISPIESFFSVKTQRFVGFFKLKISTRFICKTILNINNLYNFLTYFFNYEI